MVRTSRWLVVLICAGHTVFCLAQDPPRLRGPFEPSARLEDSEPAVDLLQNDDFPEDIPGKTHARVNITFYRWLWWPGILYLFWSMAHVCDIHFVRTIEVICERFHIPDDVAGATLMALGCNGPELALNMINIWQPSSIGVGAVVGGEVFNVLVIIGTAVLATPDEYMPLKLSKLSFSRDIFFYMASVLLLFFALRDGTVTREDALMLLFGGFCYIMAVIYLRRITNWMFTSHGSGVQPLVDRQCSAVNLDHWGRARQGTDPLRGSILRIRADMRSRLADRNHQFEDRFAFLLGDSESFVISAVADPTLAGEAQCDVDMVYDRCEQENHWHRAGLVKRPKTLEDAQRRQLLPKTLPGLAELGLFRTGPWEIIPLQDILFCELSQHGFFLHVAGPLGNEVTLELLPMDREGDLNRSPTVKSLKSDACVQAWYQSFRDRLKTARRKSTERPTKGRKIRNFVMEWISWLQFPVKSLAGASIPDMDCPDTQHWYPVAFLMSMLWLGILSSLVVNACDGIHRDFDIPNNVLGFTVAAAGTSFPNVFSGMCVARQGKAGMAVANALGANVQNVFLALAIPWTIQALFLEPTGDFPLVINGFEPAIVEIFVTLLPLVLIYFCCSSLPKWSGALFLVTYVIYLVCALKQESTQCALWPVTCTMPLL